MRADGPKLFLLDEATDWRTAQRDGVGVGEAIRLAADPEGPLGLASSDGSLGGLLLPRGMAFDADGVLYLLGLDVPWLKRFDPALGRFVLLPEIGGAGSDPRRFQGPTNIAIAAGNLYAADRGNRRVQVFALGSLALRHVWGPWIAPGGPSSADDGEAWDPADVIAAGAEIYVLDRRHGRVYRHAPGAGGLQVAVEDSKAAGSWTRIAVDRERRLYVQLEKTDTRPPALWIYDRKGRKIGDAGDPTDVRDRFDPPPLRLDHRRRFCLPGSLARECDRRRPQNPPDPDRPLELCPHTHGGEPDRRLFDRNGEPVRVDDYEPRGPRTYQKTGTWIGGPLDSQLARCQWHRVELDVAALPAGSAITVSTYAGDRPPGAGETLPREIEWAQAHRRAGEVQPPPGRRAARAVPDEFLVQSREGRYLWIKIELTGDGHATPAIRALRARYPRESYLQHLPSVYSADEDSRRFLERFLSIFQTTWDDLEREIGDGARDLDPAAVPAGPLLRYLAQWLAVPFEGDWSWEQKRTLLRAMPALLARRGTPDGVRGHLRAYLQNLTGLDADAQGEMPRIVEGFRERRHLQLAADPLARLGQGAPLWSAGIIGRLQLGVFARADEARLVSTGDPERDVLHHYAHRFRVFVPSAWVQTAAAERMVRRAVDSEKPAHTAYDLCLVEARMRVGVQATLGLDTIVGALPVAALACRHETTAPPSREPRHRLGYDLVLAGRPRPSVGLRTRGRVGIDTILT
jgi:phage tail-like protein